MKMSESGITNLTKGMNAFRQNLEQPSKSANNPFFNSCYVTLEGVINAVDNALIKAGKDAGISFTQEVTSDTATNTISVSTMIMHSSGEWLLLDPFNVPAGRKNDAQAYGSAATYAKRYALSAALGIASDVDDDGNQTQNSNQRPSQQNQRNNVQQNKKQEQMISSAMLKAINTTISNIAGLLQKQPNDIEKTTFNHFKISTFDTLTAKQGEAVIAWLANAKKETEKSIEKLAEQERIEKETTKVG